jgi:hypothetical protein
MLRVKFSFGLCKFAGHFIGGSLGVQPSVQALLGILQVAVWVCNLLYKLC